MADDPKTAAEELLAAFTGSASDDPPADHPVHRRHRPSGGAGIHADLKTFTARKTMGTTVITALVAQNTHGVSRVYPIDVDFVADQFESVLGDLPVDATKSGMLGSRDLVELVVDRAAEGRLGFYTVDPVMIATSGHRLLEPMPLTPCAPTCCPSPTSSPPTSPRRPC